MAMTKKDKTQLAILGTIIVVVLAVTFINYRDRFLPKPVRGEDIMLPSRSATVIEVDPEFFERPDFLGLRSYGEIKIVPPDTAGADYVLPKPLKLKADTL